MLHYLRDFTDFGGFDASRMFESTMSTTVVILCFTVVVEIKIWELKIAKIKKVAGLIIFVFSSIRVQL